MKKATIAGGAVAAVLVVLLVLVLATVSRERERHAGPMTVVAPPTAAESASDAAPPEHHPGFLYGRLTTVDGAVYEGRLRWGRGEEAFWGDYFNGYKDDNPWAAHAPPGQFTVPNPIEVFGVTLVDRKRELDLGKPFMARFGDIARIEAEARDILVTLKSGSKFTLDRFAADDLADGVRVWDADKGVVDFHERQIRSIEFLPTPLLRGVPGRLFGTVRTRLGEFTGFVQWNREESAGTDTLDGRTDDGPASVRYDDIHSISRNTFDSTRATLRDGSEVVLTGTREAGEGHLGVYVDDPRYGRVLVRWEAFERVEFAPGDSGPAYEDFPPGEPLKGRVTTRDGRRLEGRIVYDLDESETTETLDAPVEGVYYTVPFGLIESILPPGPGEEGAGRARVVLRSGEDLSLEPRGDLGADNLGLLVFAEGREGADYVPWDQVERIEFDPPVETYPPPAGR